MAEFWPITVMDIFAGYCDTGHTLETIRRIPLNEGEFAAEFVASNIEKIVGLGIKAFGVVDEKLKLKLRNVYKEYLLKTKEKYSKSKSFFIRNESIDLYSYYVPTGIQCGKNTISNPKFASCTSTSKRIIITGTGGSGKSVLMRHLFLDCISQKKFVPIMIELRDLNIEDGSLDEKINDTLDTYGFQVDGDYVQKAKSAGHFCFFLDGYDEVNHSKRKKLIQQISKLSNKFSECPIFISSRPDEVFNGIDDFNIYRMLPLDINAASSLVKKLPFDEDVKNKFSMALLDGLFEKHQSFLSNPLLLSIMLLTYGQNAEIPSKLSIFYNQAYEALFQRHDANKGGYSRARRTTLDIQDFSRIFSLLSLQTYEKRIFKMPRTDCLSYIEKSRDNLKKQFQPEDYLIDLLSAACLLIEDGLEISYSHRSFQEYFVALQISTSSPDIQEQLIDRYWKNMTSDNVIYLLAEINPELVERVLIVPRLSTLFSEIGVKNKVGITHAAKYLKKAYKSLNIDSENLSASIDGIEANVSAIVHLAVHLCENYVFPDKSYFDNHLKEMIEKYGNGENRVEYQTKDLTYKTPIMADTLNSKGAFSEDYLQAAYDAFKRLKNKHENRSKNLESLLGI